MGSWGKRKIPVATAFEDDNREVDVVSTPPNYELIMKGQAKYKLV